MVSFRNLPCSCSFLEPNHFFPIGILILPMYCYGQNSFRTKIRQKKVTIPILHCREQNSKQNTIVSGIVSSAFA